MTLAGDAGPVAYLLYGLPGSGKSTYARALEARGVVRLSVDDWLRGRHGRAGVDYPMNRHLELLAAAVDAARVDLAGHVDEGRDVVLDHGLGRRTERESFKRLVERHGGHWRLLVFRVDREELLLRLANRAPDSGFGPMGPELLDAIAAASEEPSSEGEEVVAPPVSRQDTGSAGRAGSAP